MGLDSPVRQSGREKVPPGWSSRFSSTRALVLLSHCHPAIVTTTSHRDKDIPQTYQAGANTQIPRAADFALYCEKVATPHDDRVETTLKIPHP
jgi:hypothetical protein